MGHKILLADDSITIQKVIELTFSDEDFELHTVGNGQKAIDEIRSIMPHIVLCDIIMPEKNGYEVCEFIKSSPDLKHIPVLLLTGAFEPFDQERARTAGCDGFLAKPFEPQTLISKVKELLARAPAASAAAGPRIAAPAPPPVAPVEERTVIMPPGSAPPMPPPAAPRGPQVRASSPPPPPQQVMGYGDGLDDAFAIEAGERELRMEPGDHTVLLGRDTRASSVGEDIWGHVDPPASSEEEDSSTVFMAPPPPAPPAAPYPTQGYEVQYDAEDLDATWRMPNSEPSPEASYSGFENFPAQPPTSGQPPQQARPPVPPAQRQPLPMTPPLEASEPEPVAPPFEPYDPFVASATAGPGFEPLSPFDAEATRDPARRREPNYDRIPTSGFQAYGEPEIVPENELESMVEPPPMFEPAAPPAPAVDRFDEIDAPTDLEELPAPEPPSPVLSARSAAGAPSFDDALIDRVAQRVVDKLSAKVIQEIAWEVVPDLAEGLIQKEIEAIKAKLPKVPK